MTGGGGCKDKGVGTVSVQQIKTRSSQRRTEKAREDHERQVLTQCLKSRTSRTIRVYSSDNAHHNPDFKQSVTSEVPVCAREHKVPTTPVSARRVEFEVVMPKPEELWHLQEAGTTGSQHAKANGRKFFNYC